MTKLCARGKSAAKRKFKVYPSAYANAYASKICAGKIKDPSGTKKKDWGPKKMKKGGGADMGKTETKKKPNIVYADKNKRRLQLKMIQNPISEYDEKGKLTYTGAKVGMNVNAGGQSAMGRLEKSGYKLKKGGGADFQTSKTRIKPYGKTYKVKIEKIKPSAFAKVKKFYGPDGEVLASGPLGPVEKKRGGGIAIRGTNFKGVF